jgi:alkylated DNA repair dioxygenase AlkB
LGKKYSNKLAASKPLTPSLSRLMDIVNNLLHTDFNGILVNEYPNGTHYIGKHSDDERALSSAGVVSVSFGASSKI